uniref:LRAT domain containing 2 n=1 Tax=Eptatretus burgeri TaxID=7764 RepID=A0A8C4QGX4_EPTBU
MGNQPDILSWRPYAEVATTDEPGMVEYVFESDSEEEEWDSTELLYSAFYIDECILVKTEEKTEPVSCLLPRCVPGDLLEFRAPGSIPHWVVYVGDGYAVSLHAEAVRNETLHQSSEGKPGRVVSSRYQYEPLPKTRILQNAMASVGITGHDLCWLNSECFAAWCRYGKKQFKVNSEHHGSAHPYLLELHLGERVRSLEFSTLEELILEKRRRERLHHKDCVRDF